MAKNQWIIEDAPVVTQPTSESSFIGRTLGGGLFKGLQGLEGLASLLPSPQRAMQQAAQESPNSLLLQLLGSLGQGKNQVPSEVIQKQIGFQPEQIQSQSLLESGLQRFISQAPLAGSLGGLSGLASTALGSTAATGAEALGLPESAQDIAQLGTELAAGRYLTGAIPSMKTAQQKAYEEAKSLAGEKESIIAPIRQAVTNVESQLGKETTKKVYDEMQHTLKIVDDNLNKVSGKLKVKDAIDLRKKLNQTYKSASENAKPYVNELSNSFNDFFAVYGAENPKFYNALRNEADKLTELKNMQTLINKTGTTLLEKFPGLIGATGKGVINLLGLPFGAGERFVRGLYNNPAARRYYFKAVSAAAKNSPKVMVNFLNKTMEELPEEDLPKTQWIIE